MSDASRCPWTRVVLLGSVAVASLALLLASITSLQRANGPEQPSAPVRAGGPDAPGPSRVGSRFTLRLGQGFRFRDAAVVAGADDAPDLLFKYLPPTVGGMSTRYNPFSQQVEVGLEPTLTAAVPLLLSTHIQSFASRPDVGRTTTGDVASYPHQATIGTGTRHVLLMNHAGDSYLLTLDELEAPAGRFDDWRIGFAYEPVRLPVGLAGGKINKPLPGRIVYRDWYRTKMIMRLDLTSGKEEAIADGILPSAIGDRLLAYADSAGAYVVRDAGGNVRHTVRFNEQVLGPVLSPDGTRLVGSVYRPGPDVHYGGTPYPGPAVLSVGVFDLEGREVVAVPGYDDAAWTPDGRLIATGKLNDPGLFEIDPATKDVRPIDPEVTAFQPSVSPDGLTIAFVTGNRVWVIGRDGKNLRQVFQDGHAQQRPTFAPDGTKLAVVICNTLANDMTGEVFVIDLGTQEITPLRTSTGSSVVPDTSTRLNWIP